MLQRGGTLTRQQTLSVKGKSVENIDSDSSDEVSAIEEHPQHLNTPTVIKSKGKNSVRVLNLGLQEKPVYRKTPRAPSKKGFSKQTLDEKLFSGKYLFY